MLRRYFVCRMGSLLSSGLAVSFYAGAAHGQTCASTYQDAEDKETAGHLVEAREQYFSCAKSACGPFLLNECTTRHARLDLDIPSVVPVATHKSGKPYQHVRVTLDGQPFAASLDGRALQLDPGMHEFAFTTESGVSVTEKALIVQGDRNRRIAVTMPGKHRPAEETSSAPAAEPEAVHSDVTVSPSHETADRVPTLTEPPSQATPNKSVPALSWVLGGVGVLGGAGFVVFSNWGKKDNSALQQQCAPNCDPSSVNRVKQRYLMADVSLGVGLAAFGSAILVYTLRGSSQESVPAQRAYSVDVHPTRAGAIASFSGAF